MATKIGKFQQKIRHYSDCVRDITKILAPNRGFSGSADLTVQVKFVSDNPCCHSNKIWKFSHKIHHNSACI